MATVVHHHFTVEEYDRMISIGIVSENDRVELIQGEILNKMPVGAAHGAVVKRLNQLFNQRSSAAAIVSIQDPIVLEDSEPEPDAVLLTPRADYYASAKPAAKDVLLLIEVADSPVEYDREVKGPLYARAGIEDYWIVNLTEQRIEVRRQPNPDGSYAEVATYSRGDAIIPLALADVTLTVDEVLG